MAERDDLLCTQAFTACLNALGALQVFGDESVWSGQYRGVWVPDYTEHTIYSDTLWAQRDGGRVRKRVRVRIDIETDEL